MTELFWEKPTEGRYQGRWVANHRAKHLAVLVGRGYTQGTVGKAEGMSQALVSYHLHSGCPPFRFPPSDKWPVAWGSPPLPPVSEAIRELKNGIRKGRRPDWSYPDEDLLRIAHEARAEIQAALAAKGQP